MQTAILTFFQKRRHKALVSIDEGPLPKQIPDDLKRWNWGAFFLNWIWGSVTTLTSPLLTFVPFFGILVMPFVLGAKGSEWAWRNGRWDSVEHFKRVQRRWAVWGFVIAITTGVLVRGDVRRIFYALKTSDAYRLGVAQASAESRGGRPTGVADCHRIPDRLDQFGRTVGGGRARLFRHRKQGLWPGRPAGD